MSILKRVLRNFAHFKPKMRKIVEGFAQFCAVLRILVPKMRKIADGFAQFCGGFCAILRRVLRNFVQFCAF